VPTVNANGAALGVESFGDEAAPLVLLAGGTTMQSWPDALCDRLAAGARRVVRYDLRDSSTSTTTDPQRPAYTLRDLAAGAAALVDALDGGPAHLAGIGIAAWKTDRRGSDLHGCGRLRPRADRNPNARRPTQELTYRPTLYN
jgi:pimeloyl-ACP methyl ester carboxylesterase